MPEGEDNNRGTNEEFLEQLQGLLQRNNNSWDQVAQQLFKENFALRNDRRTLRDEIKTLKEKTIPDGAKVLSGDEIAKYEALTQLGDPQAVRAQIQELETLRFDSQVRDLAAHHGLKDAAVRRLIPQGAKIVAEGEGDKRQYKLQVGDKASTVQELLEGEWKDFTPALVADAQTTRPGVLGQRGDLKTGKQDMVASYLAAQNKRPGSEESKS